MCGGLAQEEEERLIMPAASIAANGKNSGLGRAGIVWRTECFGSVVKKPLEETHLGIQTEDPQERRAV